MAGADPRETAAAVLDGLPECLKCALVAETRTTYPESGLHTEFLRFTLKPLPHLPVGAQDRSQALTLVKRSLSPMPQDEAEILLMKLKATTRSRSETDSDIVFQLQVYLEKLADWPADATRKVLTEWSETNNFWPVWAELYALLEPIARRRKALVEVLEKEAPESAPT